MKANKSRITHTIISQALTWGRIPLPDGQNLSINAILIENVTPEKPHLSYDPHIFQNIFTNSGKQSVR